MIRTFIVSAFAIGLAGSAFAGTAFTAKLETPVSKTEKVVAAKALWTCAADTCAADLQRKTANVATCKKLVKEIGKLASFASKNGELSQAELNECNTAAK